jgi:hypothetical protein
MGKRLNMKSSIPRFAPLAVLTLIACSQTSDDPQDRSFVAPQEDVDAYEKTVISAKASDVGAVLSELGAPWSSALYSDTRADSFSGGSVIRTLFSGASHDVFLNPDGRVWRVRVSSGFSTKCGDKAKLLKAVRSLVSRFESGVLLSDSDIQSAEKAVRSDEIHSIDLGSMRVAFSGGCVSSATISAQ